MLTILSWWWRQPGGRTDYRAEHVEIWAAMVRRHLAMPHRLACVTDETDLPAGVERIEPPRDFENVQIPTWGPKFPQCLRRLAMFRPDAAAIFGERFVSMDLDCVIGGSLDPLFDRSEDFVMYRGTTDRRPYNGSLLLMTAGARSRVYTEFTPERAAHAGRQFVGSDQAWISYVLGWCEPTWGAEHGVFWHGSARNRRDVSPRVMFFPGHPKPWQISGPSPVERWIAEHYRGEMLEAA